MKADYIGFKVIENLGGKLAEEIGFDINRPGNIGMTGDLGAVVTDTLFEIRKGILNGQKERWVEPEEYEKAVAERGGIKEAVRVQLRQTLESSDLMLPDEFEIPGDLMIVLRQEVKDRYTRVNNLIEKK